MSPRIDAARLGDRLAELATIGADPAGGVTRIAYSPHDVAARDRVAQWMVDAGLEAHVDAAGNLVGRSGSGPAIVLGSHLDTVPSGGALDGAYGVVAAVEAVTALRASGTQLGHDVWVVAFANEEGAGGLTSFTGSLALLGDAPDLDESDRAGRTLRTLLVDAGGRPDALASAAVHDDAVLAYLELHIEQGPVLDAMGVPIGVVTGIAGRRALSIDVRGLTNHAGTTPMGLRVDALATAAEIVLAVEALARDGSVTVATAGAIDVHPNVSNVVPGRARVSVDVRDLDDARLDAAVAELRTRVDAIAAARGAAIEVGAEAPRLGAACAPHLMAIIESAATELGLATHHLLSGAGHDAQILARRWPMAMVFVPSRNGVSHAPAEHTDAALLVSGAEVLLQTLLAVDRATTP